jgi:ketosteroid isomerase-like protein
VANVDLRALGPPTMCAMDAPGGESAATREELVRRVNELWNAGDRRVHEEYADPDCEVRSAMTGATYRGYAGVRTWMQEIDEQFDRWRIQLDEFAHATNDRLLVLGSIHLYGRGSRLDLEVPVAWLYEFRGDRILRLTTFATHDDGRRAAGVG